MKYIFNNKYFATAETMNYMINLKPNKQMFK